MKDVSRLMSLGLSLRQAEVFATLWRLTLEQGYQPSVRELTEVFEVTPNSITGHLACLEAKGWLQRGEGENRAVRFLRTIDGSPFRGLQARGD